MKYGPSWDNSVSYNTLEACMKKEGAMVRCDKFFHDPDSYGIWLSNWDIVDYGTLVAWSIVGVIFLIGSLMIIWGWLLNLIFPDSVKTFCLAVFGAPILGAIVFYLAFGAYICLLKDKHAIGSIIYHSLTDHSSWRAMLY